MSRHLDRLRRGERWLAPEIVLRAIGVTLLGSCYKFGLPAHRMVTTSPPHQATLGEFAICTAIVLALTNGLALTLFGPGLFEEVPFPRNSAYFPSK